MTERETDPLRWILAVVASAPFIGFGGMALYFALRDLLFAPKGAAELTGIESWIAVVVGVLFLVVGPLGARSILRPRRGESAANATGIGEGVGESGDGASASAPQGTRPANFRGQEPPADAEVVAQMPTLLRYGLVLGIPAAGVGLCVLGLNSDSVLPAAPAWVRYVFFGIGGMAVITLLHPRNLGSRFVYFFATAEGVCFHADTVSGDDTEWLVVPWGNVHDVRQERVAAREGTSNAAVFEIEITPALAERWFTGPTGRGARVGDHGDRERVRLAFAEVGVAPRRNVPRLQALWAAAR